MKKKGYYEYDPVIYPRMLCVAIGMNQEDTLTSVLKVEMAGF